MNSIPFALSTEEVCAFLGVNERTFNQSLRPVMADRGDARFVGAWAFDGRYIHQWQEYLRKRKVLIAAGAKGWHSKRKYSREDFDLLNSAYEDI